jgi:uncharacterized coiled-coil DUF342 family protein
MGKRARVDNSQSTNDRDTRKKENEVKQMRERLNQLRMELSKIMDQIKQYKEDYSRLEHEKRILELNIPVCSLSMLSKYAVFRKLNFKSRVPKLKSKRLKNLLNPQILTSTRLID